MWYFPMEWTLKFDEFCWYLLVASLKSPLEFVVTSQAPIPPGNSRATKTWWAILEADWWPGVFVELQGSPGLTRSKMLRAWNPWKSKVTWCYMYHHLSLCIGLTSCIFEQANHAMSCPSMSIHVPGDSWSSCFCAFVDALKWSMALHMPGNSRKRPTSYEKNLKHLMT